MDIISFNEAATANSRIEKINANPDSTSGILTQPSVIQSGETVSIPTGRTAIMANTQIDGTVNIDGTMFIPSGATLDGVVEKVISTDNAIVRFNGTAGDVQNSSVIVNDSGNVGIGATPNNWLSNVNVIEINDISISSGAGESGAVNTSLRTNAYLNSSGQLVYKKTDMAKQQNSGVNGFVWYSAPSGTVGSIVTFIEQMRLNNTGNLLLTSGTGAIGYGIGAGGTVTQLTSKVTSVTLNKPTGKIIMHNAALAAGAKIEFVLSNSLINVGDTIPTCIVDGASEARNYRTESVNSVNGGAYIRLTNLSGVSLSEPIAIQFSIIKGAIA